MNDNPGLHKPRAKPSVVVNSDLYNILAAIYIRDQATTPTEVGCPLQPRSSVQVTRVH